MTLLVTGGAGFIGSNFIHYMLKQYKDINIINLDKLTYAGNLKNLQDIEDDSRYTFIIGNICDEPLVSKIMEDGIDYVVNFAAETHVDRSIDNASNFIRTNVEGTYVLLEAARKKKVKKYIQISTDEVYGALGKTGYFTETTHVAPNNPYSASKAAADMLVRSYHKTHNLPVNITRCSNNYGPYQYPEKLIPKMINNIYQGIPLPVYGDGLQVRDWLHVNDHCRAIDLVIHFGKVGEIYNVGGHNERTNLAIVKKILQILGKDESLIEHVKDRLGHDYRYAIDATKIIRELNWQPTYTFDIGLEETIKWYVNNMSWWSRKA